MKNVIKCTLVILMTMTMILTAILLSNRVSTKTIEERSVRVSTKTIEEHSVDDEIEFGSYPQSKVTDKATLTALDSISKNWISYGYYSGTGFVYDGKMKPSNYMKYCDIIYNGNKYRAVTFSSYRPYRVGFTSLDNHQESNGYYTGNVYYFRYEPLKWRVLDSSEGFVMCTTIIDAQAYNNYIVNSNGNYHVDEYFDGEYYGNSAETYYASDWENSSIRAWLNDDFYNTAFSSTEKSQIGTTYNENKRVEDSDYDSANTSDKVFLLSYDEILNRKYGFSSDFSTKDPVRRLKSTDYAKCQGCYSETSTSYYGNSVWRLRTPFYSVDVAVVSYIGNVEAVGQVDSTSSGIVPAFKFNPKPVK